MSRYCKGVDGFVGRMVRGVLFSSSDTYKGWEEARPRIYQIEMQRPKGKNSIRGLLDRGITRCTVGVVEHGRL